MTKKEVTVHLTESAFAGAGAAVFGVYHVNPDIKAEVRAKAQEMLETMTAEHGFDDALVTAAAALIYLITMNQAITEDEEAAP